MIEYAFSYDPSSNPKTVLELLYTEHRQAPIYVRKNARWEEVEPDSPILTFPLLNIHHERADDAVKYWDIAVKNNNEITTGDVQPYL